MSDHHFASSQSLLPLPPTAHWPAILFLFCVTTVGGGYAAGCAIDYFGSTGAISLWAIGAVVGFLASKLIRPQPAFGVTLAISVALAFLVAETLWIHWNIKGAEELVAAAKMLRLFFDEYRTSALIGGIMAFFGAASAYRQAGSKYRYVQVIE